MALANYVDALDDVEPELRHLTCSWRCIMYSCSFYSHNRYRLLYTETQIADVDALPQGKYS